MMRALAWGTGEVSMRSDFRRLALMVEGCLLVLVAIAMGMAPNASAHFTDGKSYDWAAGKRTLTYRIDSSLTDMWPTWIAWAVLLINNADTGWTLNPVTTGGDIVFKMAAIDDCHGGAYAKIKFTTTAKTTIQSAEIVFDNDAAKTPGGWEIFDPAAGKAYDPIGVAMHEITHALRLDHYPDATSDIENPQNPGDHTSDLTPTDKAELQKAAETGVTKNCRVTTIEEPNCVDFDVLVTCSVGGIAELPEVSGSSGPNYIALAGGLAAALLALTAGGWYARRRWLS
jgi:hypothetical protein